MRRRFRASSLAQTKSDVGQRGTNDRTSHSDIPRDEPRLCEALLAEGLSEEVIADFIRKKKTRVDSLLAADRALGVQDMKSLNPLRGLRHLSGIDLDDYDWKPLPDATASPQSDKQVSDGGTTHQPDLTASKQEFGK